MTFVENLLGATLSTASLAIADAVDEATYDPFYWLGSCLASSTAPSSSAIEASTTTISIRDGYHQEHSDDAELAAAVSGILGQLRQVPSQHQSILQPSLDDVGVTACCFPTLSSRTKKKGAAGQGSSKVTTVLTSPPPSQKQQQQQQQQQQHLQHLQHLQRPETSVLGRDVESQSPSGDGASGGGRGAGIGSDVMGDDDSSVRTDLHSVYSFLVVSSPLVQEHLSRHFTPTHSSTALKYGVPQQSYHNACHEPQQGRVLRRQQQQQQKQQPQDTLIEEPSEIILTPSLMQQLQRAFPLTKRGDSFWLQYSLVRDGASIDTMLDRVQEHTRYSVLAVETVEGEIFGAFLSQPWKRSTHWSGGGDSFVWTTTLLPLPSSSSSSSSTSSSSQPESSSVRSTNKYGNLSSIKGDVRITRRRTIPLDDLPEGDNENHDDDSNSDSDDDADTHTNNETIDDDGNNSSLYGQERRQLAVYKYSFGNPYIQLCQSDRIMIGGGDGNELDCHQGFGLTLDEDLLTGRSHPCRTFDNPSLSQFHADGSPFEIRNVEVWNLTPCLSMVEAEGRKVVHRSKSRTKNGRSTM